MEEPRKLRVLTWHIHGSYLYYLSHCNVDFYIPVNASKTDRNIGRGETFPFGDNVIEVEAQRVRNLKLDAILFQADENYLIDQYALLSPEQLQLPRIYLEHDPPLEQPTNTRHPVQDSEVLIVHVTHFNRLMWDNNGVPSIVITHGVTDPGVSYKGELEKGVVVINNISERGRVVGYDIFEKLRKEIPLDLVGMGTETLGEGEVLHPDLPEFLSHYRFFFNPIRYTSLGLAVCEAMTIGMPVVGFATTEMPIVIENGVNGIIHTDPDYLLVKMKALLQERALAQRIGEQARKTALQQFNIDRFVDDWEKTFNNLIRRKVYEKSDSIYQ